MAKKLDDIKEELKTKDTVNTEAPDTEKIPPTKPRKRRVKKKPPVLPPESTTNLLDVIFKVIAARAGEHWKLTDEESLAGAQAFNAVAVKWVPVVVKYQEEAALATWLIMVLMPRLDLDALVKKVIKQPSEPSKEVIVEETNKVKPLAKAQSQKDEK